MNFLQHYFSEWLKVLYVTPVSNWFSSTTIGGGTNPVDGVVFAPNNTDEGIWTAFVGTGTYLSYFGSDWGSTGSTLTSAANPGAFTRSDTYRSIVGTVNGLEYDSVAFNFIQVTNATIGGGFAGGAIAMDSNGDRTIVIDGSGVMRIAPAGVNGSWVSPTTPPGLGATAGTIGRVIYVGDSTWFAVRRAASSQHLSVSYDDGDTWTDQTLPPYLNNDVTSIAYDLTTTRLVSCGLKTAGVTPIYYSDDDGATWNSTSYQPGANREASDLYSCGDGIWLAAAEDDVLVSKDNGATWAFADMHQGAHSFNDEFLYLMSDGRKVVAVGERGHSAQSLSYPQFI
jgi:hypothetical protein